jgi:hypothetical protein
VGIQFPSPGCFDRAHPRYIIELHSGALSGAKFGRPRRIMNLRIEKGALGA